MYKNLKNQFFGEDRLPASTKINQISLISQPRVLILPEALKKMRKFVDLCPDEISGLGRIKIIAPYQFLITDLFIFEQVVSGASTNLDKRAIAKFMMDSLQAGEDLIDVKLWWHSHVNMDTFWSRVDRETATGFANNWMMSIVTNKHGQTLVRMDIYEPMPILIDNIPLEIYFEEEDQAITAHCEQEIKKKVRSSVGFFGGWGKNKYYEPSQQIESFDDGTTSVVVPVTNVFPAPEVKPIVISKPPVSQPPKIKPIEPLTSPVIKPVDITPAPEVKPLTVTPAPSENDKVINNNSNSVKGKPV